MADNRQFTDHNEIGGVNVYLEDKKLAESPEKNTVASTDYVLLKDEDNIPRKISKANLMSVVKDAIGELLKSNDLGTSVTNVPALNASAFGSATVANLASVLGVNVNTTHESQGTFTLKGTSGLAIFFSSWYGGMVIYSLRTGDQRNVQKIYDSGNSAFNSFSVVRNSNDSFTFSGLDVGRIIFE